MTGKPSTAATPDLYRGRTAPIVVSASQRIYEQIREEIVAFGHPPGAILSRSDLADRFAVSQTPVREALQMLEQDGLIRIIPQSKTVVTRINVQKLKETHFIRVATEIEVVRSLARVRDTDVVAEAQAVWTQQNDLAGDVDQIDLFDQLDRRFHRILFDRVGVGALQDMLARSLGHLARCQRLELPSKGKMHSIVADHRAILDAIAAGDPAEADTAMRRHLSGTISRIGSLIDSFPDYFDGAWS